MIKYSNECANAVIYIMVGTRTISSTTVHADEAETRRTRIEHRVAVDPTAPTAEAEAQMRFAFIAPLYPFTFIKTHSTTSILILIYVNFGSISMAMVRNHLL